MDIPLARAIYLLPILPAFSSARRCWLSGIDEGIADIGLHASTKGNRIYAAIKGVVDAGVNVPHGIEIFPDEKRISGEHIKQHTGADIVAQFEQVREKILG